MLELTVTALVNDDGVSFDKTAPDFTNQAIGSSVSIRSSKCKFDTTSHSR